MQLLALMPPSPQPSLLVILHQRCQLPPLILKCRMLLLRLQLQRRCLSCRLLLRLVRIIHRLDGVLDTVLNVRQVPEFGCMCRMK